MQWTIVKIGASWCPPCQKLLRAKRAHRNDSSDIFNQSIVFAWVDLDWDADADAVRTFLTHTAKHPWYQTPLDLENVRIPLIFCVPQALSKHILKFHKYMLPKQVYSIQSSDYKTIQDFFARKLLESQNLQDSAQGSEEPQQTEEFQEEEEEEFQEEEEEEFKEEQFKEEEFKEKYFKEKHFKEQKQVADQVILKCDEDGMCTYQMYSSKSKSQKPPQVKEEEEKEEEEKEEIEQEEDTVVLQCQDGVCTYKRYTSKHEHQEPQHSQPRPLREMQQTNRFKVYQPPQKVGVRHKPPSHQRWKENAWMVGIVAVVIGGLVVLVTVPMSWWIASLACFVLFLLLCVVVYKYKNRVEQPV